MSSLSEMFVNTLEQLGREEGISPLDMAAKAYGLIDNEENSVEALRFFMENIGAPELSSANLKNQYFDDSEVEELEARYKELMEEITRNLICRGLNKEDFYQKLWDTIKTPPLFELDKESIYALYCIWLDDRIPYFQIQMGLQMSNEKFTQIAHQLEEKIQKAIFIFNAPLRQRTQRTSQINDLLNECETDEEKAVFLAYLIAYIEQKGGTNVIRNAKVKKL